MINKLSWPGLLTLGLVIIFSGVLATGAQAAKAATGKTLPAPEWLIGTWEGIIPGKPTVNYPLRGQKITLRIKAIQERYGRAFYSGEVRISGAVIAIPLPDPKSDFFTKNYICWDYRWAEQPRLSIFGPEDGDTFHFTTNNAQKDGVPTSLAEIVSNSWGVTVGNHSSYWGDPSLGGGALRLKKLSH